MTLGEKGLEKRNRQKELCSAHLKQFVNEELGGCDWLLEVLTECGKQTCKGWLNGEKVPNTMATFSIRHAFPEYSDRWLSGKAEENIIGEVERETRRHIERPIYEIDKYYAALRSFCKARARWEKRLPEDAFYPRED